MEAGEDGAGGVAVELLVGDGADEGFEGRARGFGRRWRADAGDERAEHGVAGDQVVKRGTAVGRGHVGQSCQERLLVLTSLYSWQPAGE